MLCINNYFTMSHDIVYMQCSFSLLLLASSPTLGIIFFFTSSLAASSVTDTPVGKTHTKY